MAAARLSLEELEAQVIADTEARNSAEIDLAEKLLNHYLTGFTRLGKFTVDRNTEREHVWFQLATRSFSSLRCAFDVLEKGYYSQAAMLSRSVLEDWLTAMDAEKNRKTAAAIATGEYEFGKGGLSYSEVTKRLQKYPETRDVVQLALSTIAYSRRLVPGTTVSPDKKYLMLGQYDVRLFQAAYEVLVIAAVRMLELMHQMLGNSAAEWWTATQSTIDAANAEIARLSNKA